MVTLRYGKYRFLLLIQSNTFLLRYGKYMLCRVTRVLYEILKFISKVGLDPNISNFIRVKCWSFLLWFGLSDLFEIRDIPKESQRVV